MIVTKRDGSTEPLNTAKLTASVEWATDGIPMTSASDLLMSMNVHFYDGIPTESLLDLSIKTADEMSSVRNVNYDKVAVRLFLQRLYKQVFNGTEPIHLEVMLNRNIALSQYTPELVSLTPEELSELSTYIDYERNFDFSFAGITYLYDKYALKSAGIPVEDPQTMFMAIAIDVFRDYHINRLHYIKLLYDALSTFRISLPTPEMRTLRTTSHDYASCVAMEIGDSIDSWGVGIKAILEHTVAGAGIGVNISSVASIGDKVKHGQITHGGKLPLLREIDTTIRWAQQNGRRGSAVPYVNFFDPELLTILALKSPRTEVTKRINDLKYCIKFNNYFYELVRNNGTVYFYSTRTVPDIDSLFNSASYDEFVQLYESMTHLATGSMPARELLSAAFATERFENGIYYVMNIDHANSNTPFLEPIRQSNICMEFIVPTTPVTSTSEANIGICILTNINQALVPIEDLPTYTDLVVRAQSHIMKRQVHPTRQANEFVERYRTIGIGFSNHAYWLAKQGLKYGDERALAALDTWCEHFQYGLMRASCDLARELSPAPYFDRTKYAQGVMPFHRAAFTKGAYLYRKIGDGTVIDKWQQLRDDISEYGMYNCALSMIPPSETSSVIANQTSGIEPIRDLMTVKDSKSGNVKQYAPECTTIGHLYDFAYESTDITERYFEHVAVIQQWIDMGISANTYINPELYPDGKVPVSVPVGHILLAHKLGLKTVYYSNVYVEDTGHNLTTCEGGGCEV